MSTKSYLTLMILLIVAFVGNAFAQSLVVDTQSQNRQEQRSPVLSATLADTVLHWDGPNASGVGDGITPWRGIVLFTPNELNPFVGTHEITEVWAWMRSPMAWDSVVVEIYEGATVNPGPPATINLGTLIYSHNITSEITTLDDFTIHTLTTPLQLQSGMNYAVAIFIEQNQNSPPAFPLGTDAGPMVPERGGWVIDPTINGQLADFGIDLNWNIRMGLTATGGGVPTVQYGVNFVQDGGNPGGLNTGPDFESIASWDTLADGSNSSNFWSQVGTIPFPFEFFGVPVTHFKASQNGLLTFDTSATALPNANMNLPSDSLPPMTVACFWDEFTDAPPTGSNDRIVTKLYGTPPNQQLWIKWFSFEYGNPHTSFQYSAVVLEESTNKIYLVDMYGSSTGSPGLTTTAGLQFDNANYIQWDSDTLHLAGNGSSNGDNDYYEFFPLLANDYAVNWIAPETNIMIAGDTYIVEAEVENKGTNAQTDVPVRLFENGTQSGSDVLVTLAPGEIDTIQFTYVPAVTGNVDLTVTSFLAGDEQPGNDSASGMATVYPAGTSFYTFMVTSGLVDKPISNSLPPTEDTLTISGYTGTQIADMEMIIDSLTHTWDSDLNMYLFSPYGDTLALSLGNGGSGDDYIGTVFDDQAPVSIVSGSPPFTGYFQPQGFPPGFGAWNTLDPDGDWVFHIEDTFAGDDGVLHQWSLMVTVAIPPGASVATLPFTEGFNDTTLAIPAGWTQVDADSGDEVPGADWTVISDTVANIAPFEGIGYIADNFQAANSQGMIDEWLITPQLLNYQSGMELSFWLNHVDNIWADSVMVLVSTTGNDPADFTMIDYINCPITWTEYRYNLENYGVNPGDNFYIAFRYYIVDGGSFGNNSNFFGMDKVTVDFPPLEPPTNLSAVGGNGYVDLFWAPPAVPVDTVALAYHDGGFEAQLGCNAAGACVLAVRFTPTAYPAQLIGFEFTQQNNSSSAVDMQVYLDPTGGAGGPVAPPDYVYPGLGGADGTYSFSIPDMIFVPSGDFYLGALEVNGFMGLAMDTTNQNNNLDRNWASVDGGNTFDWLFNVVGGDPTLYGNLGITAIVLTPSGLEKLYPNVDQVVAKNAPKPKEPRTITDIKLAHLAGQNFIKQHGVHQFTSGGSQQNTVKAASEVAGMATLSQPTSGVEQRIQEVNETHPIISVGNQNTPPMALTPSGVQQYNIYRSLDGITFAQIDSVDSLTLTYRDNNVTNGTTYWYYVTAVYLTGESGPSDTAMATPNAPPTEELLTHSTPKYVAGVTNKGNLGTLNDDLNQSRDPGFQWPINTNQMFEGAIMIGADPDQVSDAARVISAGAQGQMDHDFQFLDRMNVVIDNADSTILQTSYDDSRVTLPPLADDGPNSPLPIEVQQWSYSYTDAANAGYLILELEVTNTGSSQLDNVLVGMYHDWDINNFATNTGMVAIEQITIPGVNNDLPFPAEFAMVWDDGNPNPHLGAVPLSQNVFQASRVADNADEIFPGGASPFTEANKYGYMHDRRANNPFGDPFGPNDKSLIVGVGGMNGGFSIPAGGSVTVGMAIVGGADSAEFVQNGIAAMTKWVSMGKNMEILPFVGIGDGDLTNAIPTEFSLSQNYPNPFNPSTTIKYALKENADVVLKVYNILGQEVRTLVNAKQSAGYKTVVWDGRDNNGVPVASGVYIYRIQANDFVKNMKMVLLK